MFKQLIKSFALRKFKTEELFAALDLLTSKQLMAIDSAIDQATAETMILRELKRRGVKSLDEAV